MKVEIGVVGLFYGGYFLIGYGCVKVCDFWISEIFFGVFVCI